MLVPRYMALPAKPPIREPRLRTTGGPPLGPVEVTSAVTKGLAKDPVSMAWTRLSAVFARTGSISKYEPGGAGERVAVYRTPPITTLSPGDGLAENVPCAEAKTGAEPGPFIPVTMKSWSQLGPAWTSNVYVAGKAPAAIPEAPVLTLQSLCIDAVAVGACSSVGNV
jgi:hypothetical protein